MQTTEIQLEVEKMWIALRGARAKFRPMRNDALALCVYPPIGEKGTTSIEFEGTENECLAYIKGLLAGAREALTKVHTATLDENSNTKRGDWIRRDVEAIARGYGVEL